MGKNDVALSSYFSDPKIFADLFNAWMYGGKQVIDYRSLTTEDSVQPRPEYVRPYKHIRDVVKMYQKDGVQLVLFGIENQEKVDYSAPVRIMQFDGADYQNQVRRTEEENRKRLGLKTGLPAFFRENSEYSTHLVRSFRTFSAGHPEIQCNNSGCQCSPL